ncbi:MAG TPA: polysaccharide deacetylase family protein [Thermoguttaceae bacterium]|nr:polysaccharide deacetylase family protein [Thermoguttaceae bacterium]
MNLWKRWLLPIYYYGTWPIRTGYGWLSACRGRCPIAVVVFHRVADDQATPWTCPTDVFRQQIDWLRRRFELISLAEVQDRLCEQTSRRLAVHITFDDGYADNARFALPWLLEQKVPCTYFVSVEQVRTGKPFDHDLAIGCPLPPNRSEELRQFAEAGLEIGCHSYSHRDLGPVKDPSVLEKEIVQARWELEDLLARPVRYFAFPFGVPKNISREAFRWVHRAGYEAACSAYGGYNLPGRDPFHIRRIPVDSWLLRLKNHVLFDPRKFSDPLADWIGQSSILEPVIR